MQYFILKYKNYFVKDIFVSQESNSDVSMIFGVTSDRNMSKVFTKTDLDELKTNNYFNIVVELLQPNKICNNFKFNKIDLDFKLMDILISEVRVKIEEVI